MLALIGLCINPGSSVIWGSARDLGQITPEELDLQEDASTFAEADSSSRYNSDVHTSCIIDWLFLQSVSPSDTHWHRLHL